MLSKKTKTLIATAIIGVAAVGSGLTVLDFGSSKLILIEEIAQNKALEQEEFLLQKGKYIHKKTEKISGINVTVHEYKIPSGEVGYQIILEELGTTTSIGFGPKSESRTFKNIKFTNATST